MGYSLNEWGLALGKIMVHKKIFLHSFQATEMVLTTKWGGISPEIQICAALFVGWKEISVVLLRMNMR